MSKSHTNGSPVSGDLALLPGVGLVDLAASGLPEALVGKVSEELELFAARMRDGLLAAAIAVGVKVFADLAEAEVTEVAGPKGKHNPDRKAKRHGTDPAKVPMGGRMIDIDKPRVRTADGKAEVALETWAAVASRDLLDAHTVAAMLANVSTRNYAGVLEPVGPDVEAASSSTSRSAVCRRFVAATRAGLAEFRSRPLGDRRWLVCYIDGFDFAGETMVGALGVDTDGNKVPLSVTHGTTENKAVCTRLLGNLEERGFDPTGGILFVIDGGKAIYHAVRDKWGEYALIQRCRAHKRRNVMALVPIEAHAWVSRELNAAWHHPDADQAEGRLKALAAKLERSWPDAAGSLREGLAETITINRLGVTGSLAKTLATTNPMESTIDIVRTHAGNVKRWQRGDMRLRWAAAGMLAAEKQYRRVRGYRQLDDLARAITATVQRTHRLEEAS